MNAVIKNITLYKNLGSFNPELMTLSGHKSCTHKITGTFRNFPMKIAGIALVIGEFA